VFSRRVKVICRRRTVDREICDGRPLSRWNISNGKSRPRIALNQLNGHPVTPRADDRHAFSDNKSAAIQPIAHGDDISVVRDIDRCLDLGEARNRPWLRSRSWLAPWRR
jgi:hypothetical protein